jgi:hypothetical protein
VTGKVTTDAPLTLSLAGAWTSVPTVTAGGLPVAAQLVDGVLRVALPAGTSALVIG